MGVVYLDSDRASPAVSREEDGDSERRRGGRTRRRGAEKVLAALLIHLPPSVLPTVAKRGGATRAQKLAGIDVYSYRERTEEGEVAWEVAGDGVSSMECSEGVFIGQEAGSGGGQKVAGAVVRRRATGQCRARRPWERAGEVRSRRRGTVGVLWRAHTGRKRAERQRGKERGPFSSLSPGSLGQGPGR
jgi:hypothetical protein